jgi:hypothetical protein
MRSKVEYISIITLVSLSATFFGCFFLLYKEIKTLEQCTRDEMKAQAARTDKLYEMFVDLLKEKK